MDTNELKREIARLERIQEQGPDLAVVIERMEWLGRAFEVIGYPSPTNAGQWYGLTWEVRELKQRVEYLPVYRSMLQDGA